MAERSRSGRISFVNTARVSMRKQKATGGKIPLQLSLSRPAIAAIDRVRAKRTEQGAGRREVSNSAIVEEAIGLLKAKESV